MQNFGKTKTLVVERFDRLWTKDQRLIRLPQEDLCQALSVPYTIKYQNHGGPGVVEILKLLGGSDYVEQDRKTFLKSQIIFWLIGATDGHAKNFSIFLFPKNHYRLTPIYDVLTVQPTFDQGQLRMKDIKMAMSFGNSRHYRISEITGDHFIQTAERAGVSSVLVKSIFEEILDNGDFVFNSIEGNLPDDFPIEIHESVKISSLKRLSRLRSVV